MRSSVPALHGRRGMLAAAAVGLALAGVLTLVVGLRAHAGPPAPPLSRGRAKPPPVGSPLKPARV